MSGHYKRRRKEYVPEEKYDVDGRLVKNELYNKQIWDLKAIVNTLYFFFQKEADKNDLYMSF